MHVLSISTPEAVLNFIPSSNVFAHKIIVIVHALEVCAWKTKNGCSFIEMFRCVCV